MSFNFVIPEINIGGAGTPPLQFFRRGFNIGGSGSQPTWRDVVLSGNTALTLVNSKPNGLNYLKLFGDTEQLAETYLDSVTLDGGCEQSGTPTPDTPMDIVCNNGAIKYGKPITLDSTRYYAYFAPTIGDLSYSTDSYSIIIPVEVGQKYKITADPTTPIGGLQNIILRWGFIDNLPPETWKQSMSSSPTPGSITTYNWVRTTPQDKPTVEITATHPYLAIQMGAAIFADNITNGRILLTEQTIYIDGVTEQVTDSLGNTASAEMLLSVGDYKDTQEVLNGAVTRNVGIKILDGSENISISSSGAIICQIPDVAIGATNNPINTHFALETSPTSISVGKQRFGASGTQIYSTNYYMKPLTTMTVADAKQWLTDQYNAGTPVIIVYPLATATTETVTGQFLSKEPVTVTGSLTGLVANVVSSSHTTPTPTQPLPINCNNGVLKVSPNLFNKNSYTEINAYVNSRTGVLTQGSPGGTTQYCAVIPCLPNTTYTISGRASSAWGAFTSSNIGTTATSYSKTENGSITTGANDKYLIGLVRANNDVIDYRNALQVELGSTATSYKPYGQIYTDGTVETVEVFGKNLYNVETAISGKIINNTTGAIVDNSNYSVSDKLYLPNGTYTFSQTNSATGSAVVADAYSYDSNDNPLNLIYTVSGQATLTQTFTLSGNYSYIRIAYRSATASNVQLELGSTATTYEPYYNGGSATAEKLLKVGDYQDVQSVLDGAVTRNVGIKVLDGTENWTKGVSSYAFNYYYGGDTYLNIKAENELICNQFSVGTRNIPAIGKICVRAARNGFLITPTDQTLDTTAKFKQWLSDKYQAGSPVIVIYPLETATTETVTAQPLTIQAGTNVVEITQASIDDLELEVSYKAGVEVTVTEIENAQLDNSVEVTVNG